MDQTQLLELAKQALAVLTPIIATGALTKIGEDSVDTMRAWADRTWALFGRTFAGSKAATGALAVYEENPHDDNAQKIIEGQIVSRFSGNQTAVEELIALVAEARALGLLPSQGDTRTHNLHVGGSAQVGVATAGDVHGDISVDMGQRKRPRDTTSQ